MKRRNFLKILPSLSVTPFVVNGFKMRPYANSRMAKIIGDCQDIEGRILVLIQLKGGNDGINTVIPIAQYDTYANLRPTIKVPDTELINVDSSLKTSHQVGLHPAMSALKDMYDKGWLNIVNGVGYTSPNQSHFKSTDLWMTGGDGTPDKFNLGTGWMGRSLQALYPDVKGEPITGMPDPLGIQIGDPNPALGFHTETEHQAAINLSGQDPAGFYSLVQSIGGAPIANVPDTEHGDELSYIMAVENSVNKYAQRITDVFNAGSNAISYPNNSLANQLKTIARLIRGGCKTKIYLCAQGGYDTHSAQVGLGQPLEGTHYDLLNTLSNAIKTFNDDLEALGIADQVLTCTFSEFGRCAKENGSNGTDHGTLAPMFIAGKHVNPGVTGGNVNLSDLTNDNQVKNMQTDYRQVFATLLQDWLGANDYVMEQSLFDHYAKIPVIARAQVADPGCYYGGAEIIADEDFSRQSRFNVYPNPARFSTEITYLSEKDAMGRLTLHSLSGQMVYGIKVPLLPGTNYFNLDVYDLQAGMYILRLENHTTQTAEITKLQVVK